ncbi:hypothetical protein [Endozoicomonas sp. SESOKO1]|uniref:hypothetical protein n=1 Tax=Endozoicomonas sp. SESOKO1 TaxID=2828742 RepID=UPI0021491694|nr:hypothetical protein [Endozoicomonas sp. SESOKO1]
MEGVSGRKKQKGSFLLIVMVVMLVMTFTGLLVMEMAMLEEVTVSNEQRVIEVHQVAYSELESQLAFLEANPLNFHNALAGNQSLAVIGNPGGCSSAGGICQTVTLRYISDGPPPAGYAIGSYISRIFELDSTAKLDGNGATSSQTLGIIFVDSLSGS